MNTTSMHSRTFLKHPSSRYPPGSLPHSLQASVPEEHLLAAPRRYYPHHSALFFFIALTTPDIIFSVLPY